MAKNSMIVKAKRPQVHQAHVRSTIVVSCAGGPAPTCASSACAGSASAKLALGARFPGVMKSSW